MDDLMLRYADGGHAALVTRFSNGTPRVATSRAAGLHFAFGDEGEGTLPTKTRKRRALTADTTKVHYRSTPASADSRSARTPLCAALHVWREPSCFRSRGCPTHVLMILIRGPDTWSGQ